VDNQSAFSTFLCGFVDPKKLDLSLTLVDLQNPKQTYALNVIAVNSSIWLFSNPRTIFCEGPEYLKSFVFMNTCEYMCVYIYMYIYKCIYAYMNTYT